jgi:gag-polypeptide of LTR copia-type
MADAGAALRITKLNNANYQMWKYKVELLLTREDTWDAVANDAPDPITAEWRAKDRRAWATIGLLLEDNQLHLVRKQETAKDIWTALQRYHEKSTLSNKASLLKKICALKLSESGDMERHLGSMEDPFDQLASLGDTLAEQLTVAHFLSSLPDSYGTLITALEIRLEADLTVELVKNKLLEEYKRRQEAGHMTGPISDHKALKTVDDKRKPAGGTSLRTAITCYFCKKPNHVKKEVSREVKMIHACTQNRKTVTGCTFPYMSMILRQRLQQIRLSINSRNR